MRELALEALTPFTKTDNPIPYKYIDYYDALQLLGDKLCMRLMSHPTKNRGPKPATFYYWNVLEYLIIRMEHECKS